MADRVPIEERTGELMWAAWLSRISDGAVAKASLNRAYSRVSAWERLLGLDAKPSELSVVRVKVTER